MSNNNFVIYCVYDNNKNLVNKATVTGNNIRYDFMNDGEYLIDQCVTVDEYRGKGIYPYVLNQILLDHKYAKHYIYTDEENISSQHGILKAGFTECGYIERKNKMIPGFFTKKNKK